MNQMASKKKITRINNAVAGIGDANYNWDSFETMATFYKAEIKKAHESLNQLSVMEDARDIIKLCAKIKSMKSKLKSYGYAL
jgi:hypothetical protein